MMGRATGVEAIRRWAGALWRAAPLALAAWAFAPLAAQAQAVKPAADAVCVAGANNRYAPINLQDGSFTISNLPGVGLIPFATNASVPPFRVRATCSDGTVGETPLQFPEFGQGLVLTGDIVWGQSSPVPTKLELIYPSKALMAGQSVQGQVQATYADGSVVNVTARASGTGYRSSSSGYVGVDGAGRAFVQDLNTINTVSWRVPQPSLVFVTAENEGVTSSTRLTLGLPQRIPVRVFDGTGAPVGAGVQVAIERQGREEIVRGVTDGSGQMVFDDTVLAMACYTAFAFDAANARGGRSYPQCMQAGQAGSLEIRLEDSGTVDITATFADGSPAANVSMTHIDQNWWGWPRRFEGAAQAGGTTDASGHLRLVVPAGSASLSVDARSYSIKPAYGYQVTAGQALPVEVVIDRLGEMAQATGQVFESDGTTPATGAQVKVLSYFGYSLLVVGEALVDGSGKFAFDGLVAGRGYELRVYRGGVVGASTYFTAVTPSSHYVLKLPKRTAIAGSVTGADGQPAVGARVAISRYDTSISTWVELGSRLTNQDGAYNFSGVASTGRYRVDAAKGSALASSEVDITAMGGTTIVSLTLGVTQFRMDATVLASIGARPLGQAQGVSGRIFNSICSDGCDLQFTPDGTQLVAMGLARGANRIAIVWEGVQRDVTINNNDPLTQDVVVPRTVDFAPAFTGELTFRGQRSIYSVDLAAGDRVRVVGGGFKGGATQGAYAVRFEVVDMTTNEVINSAYGFDIDQQLGAWTYGASVATAVNSGRHLVVVTPYYPENRQLGGYGFHAQRNGTDLALVPWKASGHQTGQGLGTVAGLVRRIDGRFAVGTAVELRAGAGVSAMVERVATDADGRYRHENLPAGNVTVAALADDRAAVQASGVLAADSDLTLDLNLPQLGQVLVRVRTAEPQTLTQPIQIRDATGDRLLDVSFNNATLSSTAIATVVGANSLVRAAHPQNSRLVVERSVSPDLDRSTEVELVMVSGNVTGRVLYGDGRPAPYAYVDAEQVYGNGTYGWLDRAFVDANGVYVFPALTVDQPIRLTARNDRPGGTVEQLITAREGVIVSASDLILPGTLVRGRVVLHDGSPGAGFMATLSNSTMTLQVDTDDAGRFELPGVPVGRYTLMVQGRDRPALFASLDVDVTGTVIDVPEFRIQQPGSLSGRAVDSAGLPLAGLSVAWSSSGTPPQLCGSNGGGGWTPLTVIVDPGNGDPGNGNPGSVNGELVTDDQGRFTFTEVPSGMALGVTVANTLSLICVQQQQQVSAVAPGETRVLPDFVFDNRVGQVQVDVTRADNGQPVPLPDGLTIGDGIGECGFDYAELVDAQGVGYPAMLGQPISGVPYGTYSARYVANRCGAGNVEYPGNAVVVNSPDLVRAGIPIPMVIGRVTNASGTPVYYPSVTMSLQSGVTESMIYANRTPSGHFIFAAPSFVPGDYLLSASSYDSADGLVPSVRPLTIAVDKPYQWLDVVLDPTSTLTASVRTSTGAVPTYSRIGMLFRNEVSYMLWSAPNADYAVAGVPAGKMRLTAQVVDPAYLSLRTSYGDYAWTDVERSVDVPSVNGGTVALGELRAADFAPIDITALLSDGSPAAYGRVLAAKSKSDFWGWSEYGGNVSTDANGRVRLTLPLGDYSLGLNRYSQYEVDPQGALASVRLSGPATLTLRQDNDVRTLQGSQCLPRQAADANADYIVCGDGQLQVIGRTTDGDQWFSSAQRSWISGMDFPDAAAVRTNGNQEWMLPTTYDRGGDVAITRRIRIPAGEGYVRTVDRYTNNGASPQTLVVRQSGLRQGWSQALDVPPASTGGTYMVSSESSGWYSNVFGVAQAFADGAGPLRPRIATNDFDRLLTWELNLAPGQTVAVMQFLLVDPDKGRAESRIRALRDKSLPGMLDGLTTQDRSEIRNFNVPN